MQEESIYQDDADCFTNTETVGRWFAQHTLAPWICRIESEFSRNVFSAATRRNHRLEIDMSGFLRGDPEARWRSWEITVKNNILTVDEVRAEEGWATSTASTSPGKPRLLKIIAPCMGRHALC
ncbi:MAG: phage portal protein [Acidobacteriia bacterium]|nr:phage portal protein [Terriglobia bacterium]